MGCGVVWRRRDPRSRKRAGRRVRAQLRQELLVAARANARTLAVVVLGYTAVAVATVTALVVMGIPNLAAAFVAGVFSGMFGMLVQSFASSRGLASRSMGADAEEWTAAELRRLDRRRWAVFHDVPITYGNIDHVAVGPGRVYAIETKWTARADLERFLRGATAQARRQADDLRAELRRRGVDAEVRPLLIVWGPGLGDKLPSAAARRYDVAVVRGGGAEEWLPRLEAAADGVHRDLPAINAVEGLVRDEAFAGATG
ncbi:NERD domain-containing protein [Nitriliruptoraceae bacterium ZYF776]|nr:NERD domain-containing protein [Profundirhabdus halotolerans]